MPPGVVTCPSARLSFFDFALAPRAFIYFCLFICIILWFTLAPVSPTFPSRRGHLSRGVVPSLTHSATFTHANDMSSVCSELGGAQLALLCTYRAVILYRMYLCAELFLLSNDFNSLFVRVFSGVCVCVCWCV